MIEGMIFGIMLAFLIYSIVVCIVLVVLSKEIMKLKEEKGEKVITRRAVRGAYGFRNPLESAYETNADGLYTPVKPKRSEIDEV